jgi:hypothetical protein
MHQISLHISDVGGQRMRLFHVDGRELLAILLLLPPPMP